MTTTSAVEKMNCAAVRLAVVEGNKRPEQDQNERGNRDLYQDQAGILDRDTIDHQESEPNPGLDRNQCFAGQHLAPDHFMKRDRCGDEGFKGIMLVFLCDKVNDQRRGNDRRHEDEKRDQEAVYELVEVPATGCLWDLKRNWLLGQPVCPDFLRSFSYFRKISLSLTSTIAL